MSSKRLWTPEYIDTSLWLDAVDLNTVVLDGNGNVEQWLDKSGNEYHATQISANARPQFISNQIVFNGTDQWLILPNETRAGIDEVDFLYAVVFTPYDISIPSNARGFLGAA